MQVVHVDARAVRSLREGRPWVFSNQVRQVEGGPAPGDVVRVVGPPAPAAELGTAFYNPHSLIAVRHLDAAGAVPDREFLARRLTAAAAWRRRLLPDTDAYRLCHGESDALPGLFVDVLAGVHVVQALAAGADRLLPLVVEVLAADLGARAVVERNESHLRELEGLEPRRGVLHGEVGEHVEIDLGGLRLLVDPLQGQKTGAFLDQRENQVAAARHAPGRRVLDAYCNLGGFGLRAALAGAESVVGVDSSAPALDLARRSAATNGVAGRVEFVQADAGREMEKRHAEGERFGLVIVDPPSFTRSRRHVPAARRALRDLNRRALMLLEPGGILVTSCCSHHVHEDTFQQALRRAAVDAGRSLQLLEVRSQPPDHPVLAALPESRYLQCVIARA